MITPACISKGEKHKSEKRCQEWRRVEQTDWKTLAKLFLPVPSAPRGFSYPLPLPRPFRHIHPLPGNLMSHSLQSWLDNKGFLVPGALWGGGCPLLDPRLTFHAHAVIKTFVVEAAVVGCAEMFPEVAASSWQHSKHMWSVKLSGSSPPPRTESHWTGDPSYVWQSMPWCAIWCVSPPPWAGATTGSHG